MRAVRGKKINEKKEQNLAVCPEIALACHLEHFQVSLSYFCLWHRIIYVKDKTTTNIDL